MTIYLDIVLFENIAMNYLILLATGVIAKIKIKPFRLLLSSFIGGIYSILAYLVTLTNFQNMFLKILLSIVIVKIAFSPLKIKFLVKELILFYLVSFTFGGAAFMLLYFINPENIISENGVLIGTYPLKVALIGAVLGSIVIFLVTLIIKDRISKRAMLCEIEIFYRGKVEKIKSMIDTGNLLKEPITKEDVIIVEKNSLKNLVDKDILDNIENIVSGKWLDNANIYSYKFKVIPFSSLGNSNGILLGFKPDYVRVIDENETIRSDTIIGIYDGKLSRTNLYSSLVRNKYFKGGKGNWQIC